MNTTTSHRLPWDVLLIGGASGVGKTSVSYALARHFGVGITEVDDLHIVLECLTTPEQQPLLHYWQTNPDAGNLSAEGIMELHISVCRVLAPAINAVMENHIETHMPIVLEGDYLIPEMLLSTATIPATGQPGAAERTKIERAKGIFLFEPDETQILRNFAAREPDEGDQTGRARVSWLLGQWLQDECQRYDIAALPCRPWDTLPARIQEAIA